MASLIGQDGLNLVDLPIFMKDSCSESTCKMDPIPDHTQENDFLLLRLLETIARKCYPVVGNALGNVLFALQ